MTQNARIALFIPTTDDTDPGEIVEVRGISGAGKIIPTAFRAQAGSAGGIPEAPTDNLYYVRQNAAWAVSVNEAPNNGSSYVRKNASWQVATPFPEAPLDGLQYARSNATWVVVTSLPPVLDGGVMV